MKSTILTEVGESIGLEFQLVISISIKPPKWPFFVTKLIALLEFDI